MKHRKSRRNEVTEAMRFWECRYDMSPGMFWARLDTLCQTMEPVQKEERAAALRLAWNRQIGGTAPDELTDYYNEWMNAFYMEEAPRKLSLLFTQAGSLMAKLAWAQPEHAGKDCRQMYELCVSKVEAMDDYARVPKDGRDFCRKNLAAILTRYAENKNGLCSEQTRTYFAGNRDLLTQTLNKLLSKLPQYPSNASTHPASQPQLAVADSDLPGLFAFVEKTSSSVYQKALSRLYSLYRADPGTISGGLTQAILRDFFNALMALDIEPIDEARLQEEFPEEYQMELSRRSCDEWEEYVLAACGWSCAGSMVTSPTFYKKKKKEADEQ